LIFIATAVPVIVYIYTAAGGWADTTCLMGLIMHI